MLCGRKRRRKSSTLLLPAAASIDLCKWKMSLDFLLNVVIVSLSFLLKHVQVLNLKSHLNVTITFISIPNTDKKEFQFKDSKDYPIHIFNNLPKDMGSANVLHIHPEYIQF